MHMLVGHQIWTTDSLELAIFFSLWKLDFLTKQTTIHNCFVNVRSEIYGFVFCCKGIVFSTAPACFPWNALHQPVLINQDNMGTIELAKHEKISARSKHIDIRHHYIRSQLKAKHIALKHCPTDIMLAYMLKKALPIKQSSFSEAK